MLMSGLSRIDCWEAGTVIVVVMLTNLFCALVLDDLEFLAFCYFDL